MEPGAEDALTSIAISLKRLADVFTMPVPVSSAPERPKSRGGSLFEDEERMKKLVLAHKGEFGVDAAKEVLAAVGGEGYELRSLLEDAEKWPEVERQMALRRQLSREAEAAL